MYPYTLFWDIGLYDICLTIGIIMALVIYDLYMSRRKISSKVQNFYLLAGVSAIVLGILSAGLFQSVYNWIETGKFAFMGMTFYGGLIGGVIVFFAVFFAVGKYLFKENEHKKYFSDLFEVAPCCITIAHAFGRIGCLFAGCCFGKEVDGFPGIKMTVHYKGSDNYVGYFLPTQAYEAIFLFALFAVTSILYFKRKDVNFIVYTIGYGVWRFALEYLRADDRGALIPGITPSQFISIILVLIGLGMIVYKVLKKHSEKE